MNERARAYQQSLRAARKIPRAHLNAPNAASRLPSPASGPNVVVRRVSRRYSRRCRQFTMELESTRVGPVPLRSARLCLAILGSEETSERVAQVRPRAPRPALRALRPEPGRRSLAVRSGLGAELGPAPNSESNEEHEKRLQRRTNGQFLLDLFSPVTLTTRLDSTRGGAVRFLRLARRLTDWLTARCMSRRRDDSSSRLNH